MSIAVATTPDNNHDKQVAHFIMQHNTHTQK